MFWSTCRTFQILILLFWILDVYVLLPVGKSFLPMRLEKLRVIHTECGEHRVTHNGQKFQVSLIIISFTEHWHFFLIITLFCVSYSPEYWLVLFYSTCRSFQKGIFDVYVLWPFDKKLMCVNTCDFAVSILLNNLVLKFSKNIYQTHCKISKQPAGNS